MEIHLTKDILSAEHENWACTNEVVCGSISRRLRAVTVSTLPTLPRLRVTQAAADQLVESGPGNTAGPGEGTEPQTAPGRWGTQRAPAS